MSENSKFRRKKLRNVIQVQQHLPHIFNLCIIPNPFTLMLTFPLLYTDTVMEIVLSRAKLNKYQICHLYCTKADQSSSEI
jgi:hypothetical protein